MRNRLPNRRYNESFEVIFNGQPVTVSIGCYADGRVGEVFLNMQKQAGSQTDLAARDIAILISLAIQHGVPLKVMADALTKDADGNPEGLAGVVMPRLLEWEEAVAALEAQQ